MIFRASYIEAGAFRATVGGIANVSLSSLKSFEDSIKNKPVTDGHRGKPVGKVLSSYLDPNTGWFIAIFDVNEEGEQIIKDKAPYVSCSYNGNWDFNQTVHGINFDQVLITGEYTELALVNQPNYGEATKIQENQANKKGEKVTKDNFIKQFKQFLQQNSANNEEYKEEKKLEKEDTKKQENESDQGFFYTEDGKGIIAPDGTTMSIEELAKAIKEVDTPSQENEKAPVNLDEKVPNTDVTYREAFNMLEKKANKTKPETGEATQNNSLHVQPTSQDYKKITSGIMQENNDGSTSFISRGATIAKNFNSDEYKV